ncbi:MAG: hypothetical protein IH897_02935, partial [Planctomycetes bacterium]|nr:hypothetical protein [Planctomycetota bacterium]
MAPIISCLTNSYGRFGVTAAVENLRSAEIEWIELPIRTVGVESPFGDEPLVTTESTPGDLQRFDDWLENHEIRVASCNVTSGNPLDPQVVAVTKQKLDLARHFGVTLAVGGAGEAEDDESLATLY